MTPPPNDPSNQAISPDQLVNQLFNAALVQYKTDLRGAAHHVIRFLTESLFYAVTSAKNDPIVFLTETLVYAIAASTSGDDAARKELLKHVGDTITNATLPSSKAPAGKP